MTFTSTTSSLRLSLAAKSETFVQLSNQLIRLGLERCILVTLGGVVR